MEIRGNTGSPYLGRVDECGVVAEREVEFDQNSRKIPVLTARFPPETFLPTCPFLGSVRVLG